MILFIDVGSRIQKSTMNFQILQNRYEIEDVNLWRRRNNELFLKILQNFSPVTQFINEPKVILQNLHLIQTIC